MMCPKCGSSYPEEHDFCPNCGNKIASHSRKIPLYLPIFFLIMGGISIFLSLGLLSTISPNKGTEYNLLTYSNGIAEITAGALWFSSAWWLYNIEKTIQKFKLRWLTPVLVVGISWSIWVWAINAAYNAWRNYDTSWPNLWAVFFASFIIFTTSWCIFIYGMYNKIKWKV
jgi:hypothetical protein